MVSYSFNLPFCKLQLVWNTNYTNVKFCLQETILSFIHNTYAACYMKMYIYFMLQKKYLSVPKKYFWVWQAIFFSMTKNILECNKKKIECNNNVFWHYFTHLRFLVFFRCNLITNQQEFFSDRKSTRNLLRILEDFHRKLHRWYVWFYFHRREKPDAYL